MVVGTDPDKIIPAARAALNGVAKTAAQQPPLWHGHTSERILDALVGQSFVQNGPASLYARFSNRITIPFLARSKCSACNSTRCPGVSRKRQWRASDASRIIPSNIANGSPMQ